MASSSSDPPHRVDDTGVTNAAGLLRRVAGLYPDREAFVDRDARLSFAAWDVAADAVAARFQHHGVRKGDVVCLVMPSCIDYAIAYQAAMRLGAITSGINPRLGPREITSIFERTHPRVTVLDPAAAALPEGIDPGVLIERNDLHGVGSGLDLGSDGQTAVGREPGRATDSFGRELVLPEVGLDDPVAIVWTSGTTGVPKGAVFDHGCLKAMAAGAGVLSAPGDRRLSPLPFAHVGYMTRLWDELVHVITTVVMPTPWSAGEHLRLIEAERITVGQGVPTQWALVLQHPDLATTDVSSLRITSTGAARVPAELVRAMRDTFKAPVVVRYTSTEACISTGTRIDDDDEVVANTVGRASDAVEMRIDASDGGVGEVLLRSRARMRRYWQDPERTAEVIDADGWVHTGDLGLLDPAGNLILSGRRTEMYIRGGYNVYPAEVENVLGEHPLVAKVAVVGVPDPVLGQIGVAAVVAAAQPPTLDELRAWCKERLASYKAPDRLALVDELPLTAMLKVDKAALLDLLGGVEQLGAGL